MYGMQAFVKIKFNNIVMWLLMRMMINIYYQKTLYLLVSIKRNTNSKHKKTVKHKLKSNVNTVFWRKHQIIRMR